MKLFHFITKVRKYSAWLLTLVGKKWISFANIVYNSKKQKNPFLVHWASVQGDKTLRLFYEELDEESTVLDLGGYEGQWASDIYAMYRCRIHVFEPVDEFAENIRLRFVNNPDIFVYRFGLSDCNQVLMLSKDKDSSSVYKIGKSQIKIYTIKALDFFEENKIELVDLMKINIEGAEYDLLDHLIITGLVKKIKNIQIQFHSFVPNANRRMKDIQECLSETHELTYQYRFVWENWVLK